MEELRLTVLSKGNPERASPALLTKFGLPTSMSCRVLHERKDGRLNRSLILYETGADYYILMIQATGPKRAMFYLASKNGDLLQAYDDQANRTDSIASKDAMNGFRSNITFWQNQFKRENRAQAGLDR